MTRAQLSIVTAGCTAGLVLALIGASYALEAPAPLVLEKGDRVAADIAETPSLTIEEVNLDIGISNLIRIERRQPNL
ncbi:MAG TPA: hypothetical protein VMP03_11250 [Methylomirabilota bacterium]|nr:hypothetical protein [Methylomirabilota bacterium]